MACLLACFFLAFLGAVTDGPVSAINQPKRLQNETRSLMKLICCWRHTYVCAFRVTLRGRSKHLYGKNGQVDGFKVLQVLNNGEWQESFKTYLFHNET